MLRTAINAGIDYLLQAQCTDGHWEEFDLPIGRSDAWMTAYVGLALATTQQTAELSALSQVVKASCQQATRWLQQTRPYTHGWGFNSQSGADADSTAQGLWLLRTYGTVLPADEDWLYRHWQPDGGFATYLTDDAWGIAHPCITPLVFLALPTHYQTQLQSAVLAYVQQTRQPDGTWPAYWWRSCHYSTYWNLMLLNYLGEPLDTQAHPVGFIEPLRVHSLFDLAHVTGIMVLKLGLSEVTLRLIEEILRQQLPNGSWPGGLNLRVTHHQCEQPWQAPLGELYEDDNHLLTTATVIRILSQVMERCSILAIAATSKTSAMSKTSSFPHRSSFSIGAAVQNAKFFLASSYL